MISEDLKLVTRYYRQFRLCVLAMLLFLVATLAVMFIKRPLVFAMLAIAVLFHLFVLRPKQKAYADAFSRANLRQTVCKKLGTDTILEKAHQNITEETMEQARLMPGGSEKSAPLFRWEVSGTIKGIPVTLCDATIPQSFRLAEKGKPRVHFNAGVWAHITLPSDSGTHFRLLDETLPFRLRSVWSTSQRALAMKTLLLEDSDLKTHCVLYRPMGTEQQPSYSFCKSLKALMKYTPGYVAVSVHGSSMDVFIRGRFLTRTLPLTQKPTQQLLEFDPFPELSYLADLARSVS